MSAVVQITGTGMLLQTVAANRTFLCSTVVFFYCTVLSTFLFLGC